MHMYTHHAARRFSRMEDALRVVVQNFACADPLTIGRLARTCRALWDALPRNRSARHTASDRLVELVHEETMRPAAWHRMNGNKRLYVLDNASWIPASSWMPRDAEPPHGFVHVHAPGRSEARVVSGEFMCIPFGLREAFHAQRASVASSVDGVQLPSELRGAAVVRDGSGAMRAVTPTGDVYAVHMRDGALFEIQHVGSLSTCDVTVLACNPAYVSVGIDGLQYIVHLFADTIRVPRLCVHTLRHCILLERSTPSRYTRVALITWSGAAFDAYTGETIHDVRNGVWEMLPVGSMVVCVPGGASLCSGGFCLCRSDLDRAYELSTCLPAGAPFDVLRFVCDMPGNWTRWTRGEVDVPVLRFGVRWLSRRNGSFVVEHAMDPMPCDALREFAGYGDPENWEARPFMGARRL